MSFPRHQRYKDSGVEWLGEVPEHWSVERLGRSFLHIREKVSDKDFPPLSVTKNGVVPQLANAAKTDDGDNRKLVRAGDFVINGRSDRNGSAGLADRDGSVSLINLVLRPVSMYGNFVHHLLRSLPFQQEFYRMGKGIVADLWSTGYGEMSDIILAVPPFSEQRMIAEFLDHETGKVDKLIEEQRRLIELLKEKRHAVISHAVTKGIDSSASLRDSGVEWLGMVPEHWQMCPVRYHYRVELGRMLDEKRAFGAAMGRYLRNVDVQWNRINVTDLPEMDFPPQERQRFLVRQGDLLVCEGGDLGRSALVQHDIEDLFYQKALLRLRPLKTDRDCGKFMLYQLWNANLQQRFVAAQNKATIGHLPAETLRAYVFLFPSLNEQVEITTYLDSFTNKLDALSDQACQAVQILQERRSALISAAVTGKMEVRNYRPEEAA